MADFNRSLLPTNIDAADELRQIWRLVSPASRLVTCQLRRIDGQFELSVSSREGLILRSMAAELATLHGVAAQWRSGLELKGYVAASLVRTSDAVPCSPPSEARAGFLGVLECIDLLMEADAEAARELRDLATAGLVAVSLDDFSLADDVLRKSRAALERIDSKGQAAFAALTSSCRSLLDQIEVTLDDSTKNGLHQGRPNASP